MTNMAKKIFRSIFAATVAVLMICFALVTCVLYDRFTAATEEQLQSELRLAASGVEQSGIAYLQTVRSRTCRLTWVDADGSVLYDTQADTGTMENHKEREEIAEAFVGGSGEATRYSDTLTEKMLYAACRLSDGTVLRVAAKVDSVFAMLLNVLFPTAVLLLFSVLLSAFLARRMAGAIVKPLNGLDLEHPEENNTYEELAPMLGKIAAQHRQIDSQMKELRRRTDEFEQITSSMREGLVLLDRGGTVLTMNPAASELFGIGQDPAGMDFLTVDRSTGMSHALKDAFAGKHGEFREERGGREYRFAISRIESGGSTVGAVILCLDETENALAERSRREFTANVSHELKTPLQSIIGSAELLENGLVKPEDTPRFVGHIRSEAARLVSLINDIIRLSRLDENVKETTEETDLLALANEVTADLAGEAEKKRVTLSVTGDPCQMNGVRRYLYELLYNLCDNAIRYNREGGEVRVTLRREEQCILLSVADNGIGIPKEHQARVFERFYRVDKSHSRHTGGTGLGLSIVKHVAAYHGGTVGLESTPDVGTTVRVRFPVP